MSKIIFPPTKQNATVKQISYIDVLTIDLQMTRASRNVHILGIINRPIAYLDDMTVGEASLVITKFKEWKEVGK